MPRRTYGPNRQRPLGGNSDLIARLAQEFARPIPEWQQRRINERANRPRNQLRSLR